jgi:hypothetical protein
MEIIREDAEVPGEATPEDEDFVPELDPQAEAESLDAKHAEPAGDIGETATTTDEKEDGPSGEEPAVVGATEANGE